MKFEFDEYNVVYDYKDKAGIRIIYEDGILTYDGKTINKKEVIDEICNLIESHKDEIIKLNKEEISSYRGGRQQILNVKFEDTDELQIIGNTPIKEMSLLYSKIKNEAICILDVELNEEQKLFKDIFDYKMNDEELNKIKELGIDDIISKAESSSFKVIYSKEDASYILIEKGDFNIHYGQMTHYFVHSLTNDSDSIKFEIIRWYLETNQEKLQKIFDYEMSEEEINKITELNVNDMLGKVITPTFRIKYANLEVSGYYFISKGYLILADRKEPPHYFLNNLIFDANKAKLEIERLYNEEMKENE